MALFGTASMQYASPDDPITMADKRAFVRTFVLNWARSNRDLNPETVVAKAEAAFELIYSK